MHGFFLIFLFAFGACVGSFLNVVIYRMPRGLSIVFPGSHCTACGRAIHWYDNIPLVSWLLLGGRCRFCKAGISPRYLVVEAVTAVLVAGLYACYYMAEMREGMGSVLTSWPTFAAHAALLCALLVCAAVDIESWIVPLEVCWFVSVVGLVSAAAGVPSGDLLPRVSPAAGAMSMAAVVGLVIALVLVGRGLIQRSFLDADGKPVTQSLKKAEQPTEPDTQGKKRTGRRKKKKKSRRHPAKDARKPAKITAAATTRAHGVDPRKEVLREVLFLAPAIVLALVAYVVVTRTSAGRAWVELTTSGWLGQHLGAFQAALFGYLIGGLWIWGMRILGTLAFGKEAMGMGDVHILAAVGAVTGWVVPSVTFFAAPIFGLLWAIYLWAGRKQRELPYGGYALL